MRTSSSMIVVIAIVAALVFVAAALFGFNIVQPAYAPPVTCPNCGASELAPGEEPQAPGWDPNGASADAPGQEAEGPATCIECAKDFSAGEEGLKAGIIGPDKKTIP
jgi:hypothetical protein